MKALGDYLSLSADNDQNCFNSIYCIHILADRRELKEKRINILATHLDEHLMDDDRQFIRDWNAQKNLKPRKQVPGLVDDLHPVKCTKECGQKSGSAAIGLPIICTQQSSTVPTNILLTVDLLYCAPFAWCSCHICHDHLGFFPV